jgi:uncharacterized protein
MHGDLVYFMFPVADGGRAHTFFGELFDWEFSPGNVPGGSNISNATPPGGMHAGQEPGKPEVWFGVDDMNTALARVRELGGEADEPEKIATGSMASCRDDQGTPFNLWAAG